MAIDYATANAVKEEYKDAYAIRHQAFKDLRRFWQGDYWKIAAQAKTGRSIVSVFRDQMNSGSETLPDMKLVKNVVQKICVKYQTFLSPLPMITMYVDPPGTDNKRRQATLKERYLYGVWNDTQMNRTFNRAGWYLPLMGDCFQGCYPDMEAHVPRSTLRSPECAYPVTNFDGSGEDIFLFAWNERESVIKRQFPGYTPKQKGRFPIVSQFMQRGKAPDPEIEIMEWSDDKEFARWVEGQKMNGVEHDFGFNIFEHLKFIDVPDEPWGHGAVEQLINQNEGLNALQSLLFQAVLENVFPSLVLIDPSKAPEEIYKGPGSIIPINAGGDVKVIAPSVQALGAQMGFMNQVEHGMKEDAGLNETTFGVSPASSIVTGQAIEDLQNAGTASTVEMVQSTGIGSAITRWNAKAIYMGQTMFADDTISLYATSPNGLADISKKTDAFSIKGKQLVGSGRNEVVFMPQYDLHTKVVIGLQMAGGGLVSKKWQRQNAGIPDSDAMDEEMLDEAVTAAVVGALLGSLQQEPTPANAVGVEEQAVAFLAGGTGQPLPAPAAHPLLGLTGGGGAPPAGAPGPSGGPGGPGMPVSMPGGGQEMSPALQLPPGSTQPQAGTPATAPASGGGAVTLNDAAAAFNQVQGIQGRVFLVGQIVLTGQTNGDIEVALTTGSDRAVLAQGLPQYAGKLTFHSVTAEPNEQFVEVTPGTQIHQGGPQQGAPEPQAVGVA